MHNNTLYKLYISHGIFMFASIMLVPLFAVFAGTFTSSLATIGYLGTCFFVTKLCGTILMRIKKDVCVHTALQIGYILKVISWLSLIFVPNIATLFIIQGILGLSDGIQSPAFRAITAMNLDSKKELIQSSNWEIILAITGVAGTGLGSTIVYLYGFNALFIVMSLLTILSIIFARKIVK